MKFYVYGLGKPGTLVGELSEQFCLIVAPGERIPHLRNQGKFPVVCHATSERALRHRRDIFATFVNDLEYRTLSDCAALLDRPSSVTDALSDLAERQLDLGYEAPDAKRARALCLLYRSFPQWMQANRKPPSPDPGRLTNATQWISAAIWNVQWMLSTEGIAPTPAARFSRKLRPTCSRRRL